MLNHEKWNPAFDERVELKFKPTSAPPDIGKVILITIIATPIVVLVGLFLYIWVYLAVTGARSNVTDRMKRECERQFVNEPPERINDCVIKLQIRWLTENYRDKMESAYQRSR